MLFSLEDEARKQRPLDLNEVHIHTGPHIILFLGILAFQFTVPSFLSSDVPTQLLCAFRSICSPWATSYDSTPRAHPG